MKTSVTLTLSLESSTVRDFQRYSKFFGVSLEQVAADLLTEKLGQLFGKDARSNGAAPTRGPARKKKAKKKTTISRRAATPNSKTSKTAIYGRDAMRLLVASEAPQTPAQIASYVGIAPYNIYYALDMMKDAGYLRRIDGPDKFKGRPVRRYDITAAGKRFLAQYEAENTATGKRFLAQYEAEKRKAAKA